MNRTANLMSMLVAMSFTVSEAGLAQDVWPTATSQALQISIVDSLPQGSPEGMVIRRKLTSAPNLIMMRRGSNYAEILAAASVILRRSVASKDTRESERRYLVAQAQVQLFGRGAPKERGRLESLASQVLAGAQRRQRGYGRANSVIIAMSSLRAGTTNAIAAAPK